VLHVHTASEEVTLTVCSYTESPTEADSRRCWHFMRNALGQSGREAACGMGADGRRRRSKKAPQFAKQGMLVSCILETAAPICIERFKDYKMMGRFSLRDEGKTVAIGKVTQLLAKDDVPDMSTLKV